MKKLITISLLLTSVFTNTSPCIAEHFISEANSDSEHANPNTNLIRAGCLEYTLNQEQPNPNTGLILAIQNGDCRKVKELLENGEHANQRNTTSCTPLSFATKQAIPLKITKYLLKHGADPNTESQTNSNDHWKELDRAITFGTEEHVALLLQFGADPFQLQEKHQTTFWQNTVQKNKNIKLVQKERAKRFSTFIYCIKEMGDFLPCAIYKEIFYWAHNQSYTKILENKHKSCLLQ